MHIYNIYVKYIQPHIPTYLYYYATCMIDEMNY